MTVSPSTTTPEIEGIQFLRAAAALMVVAHHARHFFPEVADWTSFGSRGVDIFFVISGFVMAHSTRGYRADGDRIFQSAVFLLKRGIRVVPLYWLALLWTSKRVILTGATGWDPIRDLLFVPHFHRDYLDAIFPFLVPGWTINYEMFFYALFALSMLFGEFRFRFMALVLSGLVLLGGVDWQGAPMIFYTSSVLLEFLLGIGVYFAIARYELQWSRLTLVGVTVAGVSLLAIENGDSSRGFADGPFAALIVWSTVQWTRGLKLPWLHALGDASYAIYLFHLSSFWFAATLLHSAAVSIPTPVTVILVLSSHVMVAIATGLVIHHAVEKPMLAFLKHRLVPSFGTAVARVAPD
jgi:exopolysaccharide production protein ExoZ